MAQSLKLGELQRSFVRVLLANEEQSLDHFHLEVSSRKPEIDISLEVGKIQFWSVQVANLLVSGRGKDSINVKVEVLMAPTLNPSLKVSIPLSDITIDLIKHKLDWESSIIMKNLMVQA
jgi:hypothetical protein